MAGGGVKNLIITGRGLHFYVRKIKNKINFYLEQMFGLLENVKL